MAKETKKFPERTFEMTAHQQIKTPANKAIDGGIDKIAEDISLKDIANAYGIIFGGVNSIKKWSDFKSLQGKAIFSINEQISVTSKEILTEIKKISTAISTSNFEIPFLQHISESFDMFAADAIEYFDKGQDIVVPMSEITFTMNKSTASSVAKIADSLKGIDDFTLEALSNLIGVLQQYEKVKLNDIFKNIVAPLDSLSKIKVKNLSNTVKALNSIFNEEPKLSDIFVELSDSKYNVSLAPAKTSIEGLKSIIEVLVAISEDFTNKTLIKSRESFLGLYDLATSERYGVRRILEAYLINDISLDSSAKVINDLGSIAEAFVVIAEDFDSKTIKKTKESFLGLYDLATSTSYGVGRILEAYLIDIDLTNSASLLTSLKSIIKTLKDISDMYDKKMLVAFKGIHSLATSRDTSLIDIFNNLSNLPTNINSDSFDNITLIFEDFKYLSTILGDKDVKNIKNSIISMKDIIDGDSKNNLKNLFESIVSIEIPNDYDKRIECVITASDSLFKIFSQDFKQVSKNADEMLETFEKLVEIIQQLPEIGEKNELKKKTEGILKEMQAYEYNMKSALESQKKGIIHTKAMIFGTKTMSEDIEEVSKDIKNSGRKENEIAIKNLASVILAMGAMMIIGSTITASNPNFIRDAYRFGASLVVFVTMVSLPIILAQALVNNNTQKSIDGLGRLVFGMGMTMVVGALFYTWIPDFSKNVKKFIIDMTLFVFGISFTLSKMSKLLAYKNSPAEIAKLVTRCAIVMIIGALFVKAQGGNLVKASLMFGVVLGAFIICVTAPLMILSAFMGEDSGANVAAFGRLIVTSTIVMLIGALFVKNKELVKNSLKFGLVLGTFLLLVLTPIWLVAKSLQRDLASVKKIGGLIFETTIVLMIGGWFMSNPKLASGAIEFAMLAGLFIGTIVFVVGHAVKKLGPAAFRFIHEFNKMIVNMSLALMIGGVFMTNKKLAKGAIDFALLLVGFTVLMAISTRLISKSFTRNSVKAIYAMTVCVAAIGLILMFGSGFIEKFGTMNIIKFGAVIAGFLVAISSVFALMGVLYPFISKGTKTIKAIAIGIALLGLAFFVVHLAMMNFKLEEMLLFVGGVVALTGIFALLAIPYVAAAVGIGSLVATAMGVALITLFIGFTLLTIMAKMNIEPAAEKLSLAIYSVTGAFTTLYDNFWAFTIGAVAAVLLSVALVSLSAGFSVLMIISKLNLVKAATRLDEGIKALIGDKSGPFYTLRSNWWTIIWGTIGAVQVTVALVSLSVAFGMLFLVTRLNIKDAAKKLDKGISALIGDESGPFYTLRSNWWSIIWGTIGAVEVTVALTSLSVAFGLLFLVTRLNIVNAAKKLSKAIDALVGDDTAVFNILKSNWWTISVGTVIATEMTVALIGLSVAFAMLSKVGQKDIIKASENLSKAISNVNGIFKTLGNKDDRGDYRRGRRAAIRISMGIISMSAAFNAIHNAVDKKDIAKDIDTFKTNLETLLTTVFGKEGPLSKDKLEGVKDNVKNVKDIIHPMVSISSDLFKTVKNFATLLIPDQWDNKTGKSIHYVQLKSNDFEDATKAITKSMVCLFQGFLDITKMPGMNELIDDFNRGNGNAFRRIFNGKSKISGIIKMTSGITEVIGGIGDGVAKMATLLIPEKWNSDGIATHYRQLNDQDFTNASDNVVKIIETMLTGINNFGDTHKKLIDDFASGDLEDSVIGRTIMVTKGIGEMISNIANAISCYAELKIIEEWTKDGKPKKTRSIQESDFINAANYIGILLKALPNSIEEAAKIKDKHVENIANIVEVTSSISSMLADVAKVIVDYSNLRIPVYGENSLKPISYRAIDETDFNAFTANVETILTIMPKAIKAGYDAIGKANLNVSDIEDMMSTYVPMGKFLGDMVNTVKDYAMLTNIPVYGNDGKIIDYIKLSNEEGGKGSLDILISQMGDNVGKILTGMSTAIIEGYKKFTSGDLQLTPAQIEEIIDSIKPVSDIFEGLIKGVQAYAELKIPQYDKEGKAIAPLTIVNQEQFKKLFDKIETNIESILKGIITAVHGAIEANTWLKDPKERKPFEDALDAITEMLNPINTVIGIVKDYADLKIPTGFKTDGTPLGYKTLNDFDVENNFIPKIKSLLKAIPNAINMAINGGNGEIGVKNIINTLLDDSSEGSLSNFAEGFESIANFISETVLPVFKSYAEFNIPIEFDENGKPKKYYSLEEASIKKLQTTITNIICSVPNAMKDASSKITFTPQDLVLINRASDLTIKASEILSKMYETSDRIHEITINGQNYNEELQILADVTDVTKKIMTTINSNINEFFTSLATEESSLESNPDVVTNSKNVVSTLKKMLDEIINLDNETENRSIINFKPSKLNEYRKKVNTFAEITEKLSKASASLLLVNKDFVELDDTAASNASNMLSSVKQELDKITSENVEKLNKEAEGLSKYVKSINSINTRKVGELSRMFESIEKFNKSVGNLDSFTNTLANKISEILTEFTTELKNAEKTISNADKLRKEREKTMNKTLDRIADIMSKTLNVKVTSGGSSDVTEAVTEVGTD